ICSSKACLARSGLGEHPERKAMQTEAIKKGKFRAKNIPKYVPPPPSRSSTQGFSYIPKRSAKWPSEFFGVLGKRGMRALFLLVFFRIRQIIPTWQPTFATRNLSSFV